MRLQKLNAPPATVLFGPYGGPGAVWIDTAADHVTWSASLSAGAAWVRIGSGAQGRACGLVELTVDPSRDATREATLTVAFSDGRAPRTWPVRQTSAVPVATQSDNVLQARFVDAPRIMELAILGRFAAQEIAKVPEPFTLPVLALVEALIPVLGESAVAIRTLADPLVPETKTWCPPPNAYAPLITTMYPFGIVVQEEVAALLVYLPEQFAEAQAGD
ncbi:MAG: hypothetical protein C0502_05920 [Opitutus sp.]|nr:hypothetical protein [Opitutus sp.]